MNIKKIVITPIKKSDLQNNICQRVDPSKDFTIKPPKLSAHAPIKTRKGPGIFDKKFIKFEKVNFEFPFHTT